MSLGPGSGKGASTWKVPGDVVEAGVLACALLATGGAGQVAGIDARELYGFASVVGDAGLYAEPDGDRLHVRTVTRYRDRPWAGIRAHTGTGRRALWSELEPAIMALALKTPGSHKIQDQIGAARHSVAVTQLEELGARVNRFNAAQVSFTGPQKLRAARVGAAAPTPGRAC